MASTPRSARTSRRAGAVSSFSAKPGAAAPASANWPACGERRRLLVAVGQRRPRGQPGGGEGHVVVPARQVEVAERGAGRRVLDDDDAPALAVAAVRGEARRVEHVGEHLVGHGLVVELADGARAAQGGEEVEVHELPTVAAAGSVWGVTAPRARTHGGCHRGRADAHLRGSLTHRSSCRPWRAGPPRSSSSWRRKGGRVRVPRRRLQEGGGPGCRHGGGPGGRRGLVRRQPLRARARRRTRPTARGLPGVAAARSPSRSGPSSARPSWDDDDYPPKLDLVLAERAGGRELHVRPARRPKRCARCRQRARSSW